MPSLLEVGAIIMNGQKFTMSLAKHRRVTSKVGAQPRETMEMQTVHVDVGGDAAVGAVSKYVQK